MFSQMFAPAGLPQQQEVHQLAPCLPGTHPGSLQPPACAHPPSRAAWCKNCGTTSPAAVLHAGVRSRAPAGCQGRSKMQGSRGGTDSGKVYDNTHTHTHTHTHAHATQHMPAASQPPQPRVPGCHPPEGARRPKMMSATAPAPCWPGCHMDTMAPTRGEASMSDTSSGPPWLSTTTSGLVVASATAFDGSRGGRARWGVGQGGGRAGCRAGPLVGPRAGGAGWQGREAAQRDPRPPAHLPQLHLLLLQLQRGAVVPLTLDQHIVGVLGELRGMTGRHM